VVLLPEDLGDLLLDLRLVLPAPVDVPNVLVVVAGVSKVVEGLLLEEGG
jgi:hypothetical protein